MFGFPCRTVRYDGKHVGVDVHAFPVSAADVRAARRLLDRHGGRIGQSQSPSHDQVKPLKIKLQFVAGSTREAGVDACDSVPCRMGNTPDSASDNLGFRCCAGQEVEQHKRQDKEEL